MIITVTGNHNEYVTVNTNQLRLQIEAAQANVKHISDCYEELKKTIGLGPGHTHEFVVKRLKEIMTKEQNATSFSVEAGSWKRNYHELAAVVLHSSEKNPHNYPHEHIMNRAKEMRADTRLADPAAFGRPAKKGRTKR